MSRLTGKSENNKTNYKVRKKREQDWNDALQNAINKLGKLEDLEEELGCPLEVVFKVLKDGIILENEKLYNCSLSFHKQQKYSNEDYILICYENGESVVGVSVKQYKKTWWLEGEKNE